jgi:hypothetical protein
MSVKSVMASVAANKKTIIKRTLIVAGTVVGIALTAGIVAKSKELADGAFEAVDVVVDAA